MKVKKFMAILTAVCSAIAVCVFSACGNDGNSDSGDDFVSEKVTREEWEAAFSEESFQNVKVECKYMESGTVGGHNYAYNGELVCIVADGILYEKNKSVESVSNKISESERYYAEVRTVEEDYGEYHKERKVYNFNKEKEKWEIGWRIGSSTALSTYMSLLMGYGELYTYDDFKYDSKYNGYVYLINLSEEPGSRYEGETKVVIKFKNKKPFVASLDERAISDYDKVNDTCTYSFSFGGQSLTLPEVEEEQPNVDGVS